MAKNAFALLLADLRFGPEAPSWPHYSKLGRTSYHCHLKRGKPTYVACWRAEKKEKRIEVYYAGTHEKAPY
ncbi:MAG: cytotoxic translational repressor of toxin-antitoxin stability system [Chlamydiota bacterium]